MALDPSQYLPMHPDFRERRGGSWFSRCASFAKARVLRIWPERRFYRQVVRGGRLVIAPTNIDGEFEIDARSDLAARVVESGTYEPELTWILSRLANTEGTVVNVGANVGFFAVHMARSLPRADVVVAIEPNPDAFQMLLGNIQRNTCEGRIQAVNMCIGAEVGEVSLAVVPGKPEYSSIGSIVHNSVARLAQAHHVVPIDSLARVVATPVGLLVIDVEGAEMAVLKGAAEIIDKDRPIILMECSEYLMSKFHDQSSDVIRFLEDRRYALFDVEDFKCRVVPPFDGELLAVPVERVSVIEKIVA